MFSGLVQLGGGAPGRWLLVVLLALASPAFAQDLGVADKLGSGTVQYVLAVMVVVLAIVCVYLFKGWREEMAGRREDAKVANAEAKAAARAHHAETVATLTNMVNVNLKSVEAVETLERLSDRYAEERS